MKSTLILIFTLIISVSNSYGQDSQRMKGTYKGLHEGSYIFENHEGKKIEFTDISKEASQNYDLTNKIYLEKQFIIHFKIETKMINNKETQIATIVRIIMPS